LDFDKVVAEGLELELELEMIELRPEA